MRTLSDDLHAIVAAVSGAPEFSAYLVMVSVIDLDHAEFTLRAPASPITGTDAIWGFAPPHQMAGTGR